MARCGKGRQDCWIWTVVMVEADGRRRVDFEVGNHSEATFLRLYARLPRAKRYYSDAYRMYRAWLTPGQHVVSKGGAASWNEGLLRYGAVS